MGHVRFILDSNIIIIYLNKKQSSDLDKFFLSPDPLFISRITWVEVLTGARSADDGSLRQFLSEFVVQEITPAIAERAVAVRRTTRLKLPDALIYATALETGRTLVTLNSRDFPPGTASVLIPSAG